MIRVLIADDDFTIGMHIEEMLTAIGYDVVGQAGSGQEAVEMARDLRPDIILMDIVMPGELNGIKASEKIKAEWDVPIIFISGHGELDFIQEAKQIEPYGYVMKPFDENEIKASIEIALHKHKMEKKLKQAHEQLERTNLGLQMEAAARKKTERALRESEKLYRDIFKKNNAIKWLLDPSSGDIVDANPAACEFYQYSHEEITKLRLWDVNMEGEAEVRKLLASADSGERTEFTFKHRLASGEIRHVQIYTGTLETGGKKLLHSIIIDITDRIRADELLKHAHDELERRVENRTAELGKANKLLQEENEARKRSEEALRKSEEHLRSLMESAYNFTVYRLISDGDNPNLLRVIFVSPSITEIMGVSEPMSFESWFKHIHPDDVERVLRANIKAFETLQFDETMRIYHPQKQKWIWIHAVSTGFEDKEHQCKYVNGILIDVTREKNAEEALRKSDKRLNAILDATTETIVLFDREGIVHAANQTVCDRLGTTKEEFIGKRLYDFFPPDVAEGRRQKYNEVFDTGKPVSFEDSRKGMIFAQRAYPILDDKGQVEMVTAFANDKTDREEAEEALRESEERYRNLVEESFDGIFIQKGLNIIFSNKRLNQMLGYGEGELLGRNHWVVYHPDFQKLTRERAQARMSGEEVAPRYEVKLQRKDGSWFYGEINAKAIIFPSDKESGIQVWIKDIDERKHAEEALRESGIFLKTLIDAVPTPVFYKGRDGKYLGFNRAFETFFGETHERLIGKSVFDINPPELAEIYHVQDDKLFNNGGIQQYESQWENVHGQLRDFIFNKALFTDSKGAVAGLIGVLIDITERKRAEEALRESEEYHRGLFEWSPTALLLQDFAEVEEQVKRLKSTGITDLGNYLRANPQEVFQLSRALVSSSVNQTAVDLYNAGSKKNLIGSLHSFLIEDDSQHFIEQVLKFTDGEDSWEGEARNYTFQKEIIEVVIRKVVINRQANGLSKILVSITDVTELHRAHKNRKRLEAQLQQAQKMEAIGTLAGGIAHDFNNLLMAIQGRTSIMLMDKDSSHPDFRHLKGIEGYIGNAADLTKQLLGFARGGRYEVKPTDLNELIKKESRGFGRTKKEITIHEKYQENLWSVEVDRGQIQQVLLNLYINAWQAMPGGGDLYLETENMTLDESYVKPFSIEPGRYVKISITDTGIGMDKTTQEKIFDPFFTTKGLGGGTGLGLASVYGIIKNHGGFINVYSEKGNGSTFNIYLPASEKKVIEERKLTGDTLGGFETVLFVDDEKMITEVGKELLDRLGYRVQPFQGA